MKRIADPRWPDAFNTCIYLSEIDGETWLELADGQRSMRISMKREQVDELVMALSKDRKGSPEWPSVTYNPLTDRYETDDPRR